MEPGARTPEELDTLLEDAVVLRDRDAITELYEPGAVLLAEGTTHSVRGPARIAGFLRTMWQQERTYLSRTHEVVQADDTALVVGDSGTSVARKGGDGRWRFVISRVLFDTAHEPHDEEGTTMTATTVPQAHHTPAAHLVRPDEGQARWLFDSLVVLKVTGAHTHGRLAIFEATDPPNSVYPWTISHRHDMTLLVLDGSATFQLVDGDMDLTAGDLLVVPHEVPFSQTTGEHGCRWLLLLTPAGPEELMTELSRPADTRELPPDAGPPVDRERLLTLWASHGFEPIDDPRAASHTDDTPR
jgi:mannose-6-phosphate isomerase-like protein (cupin superfamily)